MVGNGSNVLISLWWPFAFIYSISKPPNGLYFVAFMLFLSPSFHQTPGFIYEELNGGPRDTFFFSFRHHTYTQMQMREPAHDVREWPLGRTTWPAYHGPCLIKHMHILSA